MIQKITLALIAIVMLSSCAGKLSLVKRRYTKGYYVSSTGKHAAAKKEINNKYVIAKAAAPKHEVTEAVAEPVSDAKFAAMPVIKNTEAAAQPALQHTQQKKAIAEVLSIMNHHIAASHKNNQQQTSLKKIKAMSLGSRASDDANLLILVILCFLWWFNLIAVYIKDGKTLTLNFLITFLLDFTIIGGIIYSLLVVLDVVDLK